MTQRSYVAQQFVDNEIGKALTHSGLPTDSPMRVELEHEAEITGVRDVVVRASGKSLEDRIADLRRDPRYAGAIRQPVKVAKNDMKQVTANFDAIAKGTTCVVD